MQIELITDSKHVAPLRRYLLEPSDVNVLIRFLKGKRNHHVALTANGDILRVSDLEGTQVLTFQGSDNGT